MYKKQVNVIQAIHLDKVMSKNYLVSENEVGCKKF